MANVTVNNETPIGLEKVTLPFWGNYTNGNMSVYNFDQFIAYAKKNNTYVRAYNVAGIKIKCEEEFKNSTQKMRLHFYGKDKVLDKEISFNETIPVDTDIYNRYDWSVKNGILYVTLYEKINPKPDFRRIEKESKKTDSKEDKSNVEKM